MSPSTIPGASRTDGCVEAWHAGPWRIAEFRPCSHFGTREAAVHAGRRKLGQVDAASVPEPGKLWLHRVSFPAARAFEMRDTVSNTWLEILQEAQEKGVIGEDERLQVVGDVWRGGASGDKNRLGMAATARLLAERGYDAIVYRNDIEDAGSVSWMALKPEAVVVHEVHQIDPEQERAKTMVQATDSDSLNRRSAEIDGILPHPHSVVRQARDGAEQALEFLSIGRPVTEQDLAAAMRNTARALSSVPDAVAESLVDRAFDGKIVATDVDFGVLWRSGQKAEEERLVEAAKVLAPLREGMVLDGVAHRDLVLSLTGAIAAGIKERTGAVADAVQAHSVQVNGAPSPLKLDGDFRRAVIVDDRQGRLSHEDMAAVIGALMQARPTAVLVVADDDARAADLKRMLQLYKVLPKERLYAYGPTEMQALPPEKRHRIMEGVRGEAIAVIGRAADPVAATLAHFAAAHEPKTAAAVR